MSMQKEVILKMISKFNKLGITFKNDSLFINQFLKSEIEEEVLEKMLPTENKDRYHICIHDLYPNIGINWENHIVVYSMECPFCKRIITCEHDSSLAFKYKFMMCSECQDKARNNAYDQQ